MVFLGIDPWPFLTYTFKQNPWESSHGLKLQKGPEVEKDFSKATRHSVVSCFGKNGNTIHALIGGIFPLLLNQLDL